MLSADHVVGRMPGSGLRLDESFVSAAHALLRWNGHAWEVRDLGSRNGTYVDGSRLGAGESVLLRRGTDVTFGDSLETWCVLDDSGPTAVAMPLDGGEPCYYRAGTLVVPSAAEPLASIFPDRDQWCLELNGERQPLEPGAIFDVDGRSFRFECPLSASATVAAQELGGLDETTLQFRVSADEEHVEVLLRQSSVTRDLGERTFFYLALVLARQRLADRVNGAAEPGWLYVDAVLSMIPEYSCCSALNVEIYRLRRAFGEAGLRDAASIVERRRGQLRLGTERVEFSFATD